MGNGLDVGTGDSGGDRPDRDHTPVAEDPAISFCCSYMSISCNSEEV